MFTRDTPHCGIDSVYCAEVRFVRPYPDGRMNLRARLVYLNKETGVTFGSCPLTFDSAIQAPDGVDPTISKATFEKFEEFLNSLESDLGRLVFEHGHTLQETINAETENGFGEGGLGGER